MMQKSTSLSVPVLIVSLFLLTINHSPALAHEVAIPSHQIDITPNIESASPKTKALLKTLAETMFTSKILSGQNVGSANYLLQQNYEASVIELQQETGKIPAIFSVDYAWEVALDDYTQTNTILERHLNAGGIVTVSMHPGNPFLGGGLYTKGTGDYTFDDLFKPGTKPYIFWQTVLVKVADGLEKLQQNHTVLWRPLHEMNGAWFWWGGGDADQITHAEFKKLWLSIYTYFESRKLDNLLWVYSPNSHHDEGSTIDVLTLYPGDQYVDVVALDYYSDTFSLLNKNGSVDKLLSLNKPFGFAEFGQQSRSRMNNYDALNFLKNKFPQTGFVIYWHTNTDNFWPVPRSIIDNKKAKEFMNDPRVITLAELQ
ncbi:glycosyl hydrolase [Aliiglaciecola litoralis]|uniref:Mannan endo-1,4-beta-mannosidase n=1 Tax=Aliiglaciecola litoralis TaxID=582857 RepID=A0ABP3WSR8_9ALTE